jgi:hypothetical protein
LPFGNKALLYDLCFAHDNKSVPKLGKKIENNLGTGEITTEITG